MTWNIWTLAVTNLRCAPSMRPGGASVLGERPTEKLCEKVIFSTVSLRFPHSLMHRVWQPKENTQSATWRNFSPIRSMRYRCLTANFETKPNGLYATGRWKYLTPSIESFPRCRFETWAFTMHCMPFWVNIQARIHFWFLCQSQGQAPRGSVI